MPKPPEYLPPTEELPPELEELLGRGLTLPSTDLFLDYWERQNPQGLYEMQLTDYLARMYQQKEREITDALRRGEKVWIGGEELSPEETYQKAESKLRQSIEAIYKQMKFKQSMNMPIQDMPFYDEVKKQPLTPSVQKGYNEFIKQRQLEEMAATKERGEFEEKYKEWSTGVASKAIAGTQKERLGEYEQAQQAMKYPLTPSARATLLAAVEKGMLSPEEAYGPGSAWDKWAKEQSQQYNQQRQAAGKYGLSEGQRTLLRLIPEARQLGLDTSSAEEVWNQPDVAETSPYIAQTLNEQIKQAKRAQAGRQSSLLAAQYPEQYQAWQAEYAKGYGGNAPPQGYETDFYRWAMAEPNQEEPTYGLQTAFKQFRTEQETKLLQDYDAFYPAYKQWLGNVQTPQQYRTIDQWIAENPELKLAWEQYQIRPKAQKQPYARWR